jgi:hypothetical protein
MPGESKNLVFPLARAGCEKCASQGIVAVVLALLVGPVGVGIAC